MPDSIFMHELLPGVCVEDAIGVSIAEPRVKFVKGWLTGGSDPSDGSVECGDGTAYPLEVTLPQLWEIFYRVKDAWFTGGSISIATGDPLLEPTFSASLNAPSAAPTNRASYSAELRRGYTTITESGSAVIPDIYDGYFGEEYDAGSGAMYRDIAGFEKAMWAEGEDDVTLPYWDTTSGGGFLTIAFSFEHVAGSVGESEGFHVTLAFDPAPPTYLNDASAFVKFNGAVAVIRENEGDSFLASTNRFFVGVEFFAQDGAENFGVFQVSTNLDSLSGTGEPVERSSEDSEYVQYAIHLSGEVVVSCPVYVYYGDDTTYPYPYGEDFTHVVQEWWPYATPGPTWNHLTGEPN